MSKIVFNVRKLISCMTYDCSNQIWYFGTLDGFVMVLNTHFEIRRSWKGHRNGISGLVFPSDGGLVSGSYDSSVKKWDLETGEEKEPLVVWARNWGGGFRLSLAELPGGRVATGCQDGTVRVLDLGTGQEVAVCRGHTSRVYSVISIGAGTKVYTTFASASCDGTVRMWMFSHDGGENEVEGGITPGRVMEVGSSAHSLSLSPCGMMLAAGCADGTVHLFQLSEVTQGWDTDWSKKVDTAWVLSVTFSPDGRLIASGSNDGTVKILCSKKGTVLRTLEGHTAWVESVLFQNGIKIISCSGDKTVRVWRLYLDLERQLASLIHGNQGSAFNILYRRLQKYYL